jgi:hypothetical protein
VNSERNMASWIEGEPQVRLYRKKLKNDDVSGAYLSENRKLELDDKAFRSETNQFPHYFYNPDGDEKYIGGHGELGELYDAFQESENRLGNLMETEIYDIVDSVVPKSDDPSMPSLTFRVWLLGTFFIVLLSSLNTLFSFRTNYMVNFYFHFN